MENGDVHYLIEEDVAEMDIEGYARRVRDRPGSRLEYVKVTIRSHRTHGNTTVELKPNGECVVSTTALRGCINGSIADYEDWLESKGDLGSDASGDDAATEDDSD